MNAFTTSTGTGFQWVLQNSWQAAVLAAVLLVIQWTLRKRLSPGWRCGLWLLVVARLMMPVSPQSAISMFNLAKLAPRQQAITQPAPIQLEVVNSSTATQTTESFDARHRSGSVPTTIESPAESQPRFVLAGVADSGTHVQPSRTWDWSKIACGIWLAGVFLLGLRLARANVHFRRLLARRPPVSDARIIQLFEECAEIVGLRWRMTLIETEDVESPAVCGLWNKKLLLPVGTFESFTMDELRHIFLHELAHIKRRDLEINWLAAVLQILHWFNPMIWLAFSRMRAERELATDALALAHIRESESTRYGETILKVLENLAGKSAQPGLVGIAESKARMKERLLAIVNRGNVRSWRWAAVGIAVVLAAIGLTSALHSKKNSDNDASSASDQQHFTIRVLDYDAGTPLIGVNVTFTLDYFGKKSRQEERLTDKDGRAAIEFSMANLTHLSYQTQKTNYLVLHGEWSNQELELMGKELQIKLSQGLEIGGTVKDENGRPVSGANISFDESINMLLSSANHGIDHEQIWSAPSGEHLATSDSTGQWKAKCIWPSVHWASLRIHHPDFADVTYSTGVTKAMEAEGRGMNVNFDDLKNRVASITLTKGVAVNGRVVNEAGMPLSGLKVSWAELLTSPHSSDKLLGLRKVTTDGSGKFHLNHAPQKHLFFLVQTPGYAPTVAELDPEAPASEIVLHLTKGKKLIGEIKDNKGETVANARVSFADFSIWRGVHWETVTDSSGRFEWNDAPPEKFELQIEKDGFITQKKIVEVADDGPVTIRLNHTLKITGNIVDAETKEPINDFHIDWMDRSDPKDFDDGYRFTTIQGSNGIYSLDLGRLYADTWQGGYAHDCIFRVGADGYASVISRVFNSRKGDVGDVSYDVELTPVHQISGTVVDGDDRPVEGAQVALKLTSSRLRLSGKPVLASVAGGYKQTDAQGRFRLNAEPTAQGLVAVNERGFAELGTNELSTNLIVKLQPWGRIEGSVWEYDKPVLNEQVWASSVSDSWPEVLGVQFVTNSNAQGRFAFEFVPPGKYSVYRMIPKGNGATSGPREVVRVEPGAIASVKVGGKGRPVVGQFTIANPYVTIDWQKDYFHAHSISPQPPKELKTAEEFAAWRKRPEVQQAYEATRNYPIKFAADGSFRIEEMMPGKYELPINIYDPRDPEALAYSKYIVNATKTFEVPQTDTREPLDIGNFEITLKNDAKLGTTEAPDFEATDMDDKSFKLSDFHGKYVLLDFWATWCGPCIGEFPYLKQLHEKYKDRNDFVIIGLSVDKTINEPRDFLKKNNLPWMQLYLGNWADSKVPAQYGVQGIPSVFLINPDGKIIDSDMEDSSMIGRIGKHLK